MFRRKKTKKPKVVKRSSGDGTENYFIKLVLLGDGAVGKTSIRRNYLGQGFTDEHMMTIGADFAAIDKYFEFGEKKFKITFQIWDLAGQSTFNNVRAMYYKGCFGGLLIFDRTRPSSFENIDNWVQEMTKNNTRGNVPLILLGNKADLVETAEEVVSHESVEEYLAKLNKIVEKLPFDIAYFDTSALTGHNIDVAFELLAKNILTWLEVI